MGEVYLAHDTLLDRECPLTPKAQKPSAAISESRLAEAEFSFSHRRRRSVPELHIHNIRNRPDEISQIYSHGQRIIKMRPRFSLPLAEHTYIFAIGHSFLRENARGNALERGGNNSHKKGENRVVRSRHLNEESR